MAQRRNIWLVLIALIIGVLIVLALTIQNNTTSNSASGNGVKLTGFSPYPNSGAQVAYQLGILESGVNVGEVAIAAGTVNSSTTPVLISLLFMSNTSFNFVIDCVSFSISQQSAEPSIGSVQGVGLPQINLHPTETNTSSSRVVSFCNAQYVNKEGWAQFNCFLAPNGTSPFIVGVTLSMTRGTNDFNASDSITLNGLT